jgi:type VI secretion system protein ImpH
MANSILIQRFRAHSHRLIGFSWQALARLIPSLERAGMHFFYRVDPRLAFPGREVQTLEIKKNQVSLSLNFMGLQGASTPLPVHYSELIVQDDPNDSRLNEFYNFFNQQWFRHLLAIQLKYAYLPQLQSHAQDQLTLYLLSFAGLRPNFFNEEADYLGLLRFMPMLLGRQLSQTAWCQLIQEYFGCQKVWVKQWVPQRIKIPLASQNSLGKNIALGVQSSLGEYVTQMKVHAELHLCLLVLNGFLPHQYAFKALKRLLRWVTPNPIDFTVVLHVEEGGGLHLNRQSGLYLGWNTLLSQALHPHMEVKLRA